MTRPRLLDLFCCAGGAAKGYHDAGFDVVGVDIRPQPRYPYLFVQADALEFLDAMIRCTVGQSFWLADEEFSTFDAIHASPPCQRFSDLAKRNGNAEAWPDLIAPVRRRLKQLGLPYVIENVEGAPLVDPVMLCGTMFGLRVLRHRLFESNVLLAPKPHGKHPLVFTHDKRKAHYGKLDEWTSPVQVTGGGNCSKAAAADAMGIDWMTKNELNEAIPPAYTEWLGKQVIRQLVIDRMGEAA
jgi:DNA (cytosine-5)-methyltransferase 1